MSTTDFRTWLATTGYPYGKVLIPNERYAALMPLTFGRWRLRVCNNADIVSDEW